MGYYTNYQVLTKADKLEPIKTTQACFSSFYGSQVFDAAEVDVFIPIRVDNEANIKDNYSSSYTFYKIDKEILVKYVYYLKASGLPIELIPIETEITKDIFGWKIKFKMSKEYNDCRALTLLVLTIIRYTYEQQYGYKYTEQKNTYFHKIVNNFVKLCENIKDVDYHKLFMIAEQSAEGTIGGGHSCSSMYHNSNLIIPITWEERVKNCIKTNSVNSSTVLPEKSNIIEGFPGIVKRVNDLIEANKFDEILELYKFKESKIVEVKEEAKKVELPKTTIEPIIKRKVGRPKKVVIVKEDVPKLVVDLKAIIEQGILEEDNGDYWEEDEYENEDYEEDRW